jgi:RNA polymerase sigma-70 factor (ECF subfamily)
VQSERVAALKTAIAELTHDLRTTLLLYEYEGLSYHEIAEVVGCTEKGVESRLSRARTRLRKVLADHLDAERSAQPMFVSQRG